jgi:hypothetical protein
MYGALELAKKGKQKLTTGVCNAKSISPSHHIPAL